MRRDGFVHGGRLDEPEGADNYIDELAAQIDMALAEDRGARVIVTFDAVSPLKAARRFRRACNRQKQGYYVGSWLSALLRLLDRCEVVVFLWQKSHVGSPPNEWVDRLADIAAESDAVLPVPRLPVYFASLRPFSSSQVHLQMGCAAGQGCRGGAALCGGRRHIAARRGAPSRPGLARRRVHRL